MQSRPKITKAQVSVRVWNPQRFGNGRYDQQKKLNSKEQVI